MRPRVARQIVREYVYVYSAVAPSIGKILSLLLPRADTAMMNLFLEHVSQELGSVIRFAPRCRDRVWRGLGQQ
jgi:hypothetical protein